MPKVFISHSWDDNDIARKIAEYIKRDGAEIWIDYARITGGESLPDRISEALEWCDTLVLVWSQSAANSYYVKLEWQSALDLKKRIIPCLLDDAKRPAILRGFLYIDFQNFDQGYINLCRALRLKLAEVTVPQPAAKQISKKEPPTVEHPITKSPPKLRLLFRHQPITLSENDVKGMLKKHGFFCRAYDWNKKFSNPNGGGFANQYEPKTIQGDLVVIDNACGLMWQQGGSSESMIFEAAKTWIDNLKEKGYAGYHDWRLPTLEEAMSLMEPKQLNGDLYIDPKFDSTQR